MNIKSVVLLSVIIMAITILLPFSVSADISMVEVSSGASVRSTPGFNGEKIVLATVGQQYYCLGSEGSWYQIQMENGQTGWLPKDSCKLVTIPGIPTTSAKEAFSNIILNMKQPGGFVSELPETYSGKTVLGVYYNLDSQEEFFSTDTSFVEEERFGIIPQDFLAADIADADWALLIYPVISEESEDPVHVSVFAVDIKNRIFYEPYAMEDHETILVSSEQSYYLDSMLRDIRDIIFYPKWEKAYQLAHDVYYQAGLQYMNEQKYYSAYEAFQVCDLEEAYEMAQKCIQPWPKTGEIWHSSSIKGSRVELTVSVNQDSDTAMLVRIYKNGEQAACLFIAGTGKATTKLPDGTYTIKDGTGTDWFGIREAFGRYGNYETMTFGEEESTMVKLESGYGYTITVNVQTLNPDADGVGSEYQNFDEFAE